MKAKVIFEWNPRKKFENADSIKATLSINDTHSLCMILDNTEKTISYLSGVKSCGLDLVDAFSAGFRLVSNSKSMKEYEFMGPDKVDEKKFISGNEYFHGNFYLTTRYEQVPHEKYCKFYGSTSMIWNLDLCQYPTGTAAEQFVQTLYDMEHRNPDIYGWTNAAWSFVREMQKNEEVRLFYEQDVTPLIKRMQNNAKKKGYC